MTELPRDLDDVERALAYHRRTRHAPGRYARALGYMDWATQPDPFRRFEGAQVVALDRPDPTPTPSFDALYETLAPRSLDRAALSQLLFDALALSAWKQHGQSRWSLRVNPSSGNLHPTEAYVIAPALDGMGEGAAVWHYQPFVHGLERRRALTPEALAALAIPEGAVLLGLSSIHLRESWKYGERAYRYCQHDVGHALGALAYAAAALGWRARVTRATDDDLSRLLGLDAQHEASPEGAEREHPDVLVMVGPPEVLDPMYRPTTEALTRVESCALAGTPARLCDDHHPWPVIDEVAHACRRAEVDPVEPAPVAPAMTWTDRGGSARHVLRTRRSAVSMDGVTRATAEVFHRMLARLAGHEPQATTTLAPRVHPALLVHRVEGVEPGLYLLPRTPQAAESLRACTDGALAWEAMAPAALGWYRLLEGDAQAAARAVMCGQDIAADGAFTVAFLGELAPALREGGAHRYRARHWEAGLLGQVLYLEAEASGLRATGIGCFFDERVHDLLGLDSQRFAMLYGLSVGGPVDDARLVTLEGYAHLAEGAAARGGAS